MLIKKSQNNLKTKIIRFRDKIHYFYGTYLLKGTDTINAETELNASLQTKSNDTYLKSLIYE